MDDELERIPMCGATKSKAICDFRAGHEGHLDSAADVEWEKYPKQKYCCSVCAQKRRCRVCDAETELACSDCAIDLGATVYVCKKKTCRDYHEKKCGQSLRAQVADLQAKLEEKDVTRSDAHLLRSHEALKAQLHGCELAARDYEQAAEYGKTVGFGDEFKAVLVCRDSLNAAIQRYLDAEAKPVNQVLAVSIAEEAFRLLASHVGQNSGFWIESAGTIDATVYWSKAREIVHARAALTEAAALQRRTLLDDLAYAEMQEGIYTMGHNACGDACKHESHEAAALEKEPNLCPSCGEEYAPGIACDLCTKETQKENGNG